MTAEIITIGDEILIGQIVDTNSQWIAKELNKIGVSVFQVTSIQDEETHILNAIRDAENRVDIVLITGGLGPTKDDITKHTLAKYYDDHLILDIAVVTHVKEMFALRNIPFSELNRLQGMVPSKCTVLHNEYGTAPGMLFYNKGKVVVSMPGVPYEMKGLMSQKVIPLIQQKFSLPHIIHRTVVTQGIGESALAEKIENWENELPSEIKLAYLPSPGKVKLRLSSSGSNKALLQSSIENQIVLLQNQIPKFLVSLNEENDIVSLIAELLLKRNATLSVAESCTGGKIANLLTEKSGASSYFKGGVVAYSSEIKKQLLKVSKATLEKYSVVSNQVAEEMALGVKNLLNSTYAIATTGNAGPTTDKTDKTVGVVCIAIATPEGVYSQEFNFGSPREKVILRSSNMAFELFRKEIEKNYQK